MDTITVSSKFQVVIPKAARRRLRIRPGQKLHCAINERSGELVIQTASQAAKLYGSLRGAWGTDADRYAAESRAEANRDRA